MIIKEIYIYGYGKFINYTLKDLSSLQVFYGENEAGKSTLMSFVHSILFGFPTKQQAELRYEPKGGAAYGGKLILQTKAYGEVAVERVKGKATGDVHIMREDGIESGEEFLAELLNGMDKTMYHNTFSFALQDIQDIERLKGEDINKYLVAAGTFGTDILMKIEQELEEESRDLFKPAGRKPVLNKKLKELREQDQKLRESAKQSGEYERLLSKLETVKQNLKENRLYAHSLRNRLSDQEKLLQDWPLLVEYDQLQHRLSSNKVSDFPASGIQRLERLKDKLMEKEAAVKSIKEQVAKGKAELDKHKASYSFNEERTDFFLQGWPDCLQEQKNMEEQSWELENLHQKKEELFRELGIKKEQQQEWQQQIADVPLGIDIKTGMRETYLIYRQLLDKEKDLNDQLNQEEAVLEQLEKRCDHIETQLADEAEYTRLKSQAEAVEEVKSIESEQAHLLSEIKELEQHQMRETAAYGKVRKKRLMLNLGFSAILLATGIFTRMWLLWLFAAVFILYTVYAYRFVRHAGSLDWIGDSLARKRESLQETERLLAEMDSAADSHQAYEKQLTLREEWKDAYYRLEQQERQLQALRHTLSNTKENEREQEEELINYRRLLLLDDHITFEKLEETLEVIRQIREIERKSGAIQKKLAHLQDKHVQWKNSLSIYLEEMNIQHFTHQETALLVSKLKAAEEKEKENNIAHTQWANRLEELQSQLSRLEGEKAFLLENLMQLLQSAGTRTEEEFRKLAEKWEEKKKCEERLAILQSHIQVYDKPEGVTSDEIEAKAARLKQKIQKADDESEEFRRQIAATEQNIAFLEEGGTYTENLHLFRKMQDEFRQDALKWAKTTAASTLLRKMTEKYRKDRFPRVISKATEYFSYLTNQEYTALHMRDHDSFLVERSDRQIFHPRELSRGTGEQLYTAIRLALINVLKEEYPFPVMVDDSFVNFDASRNRRVLQLIHRISSESQVLFFTCHQHTAAEFPAGKVYEMSSQSAMHKMS